MSDPESDTIFRTRLLRVVGEEYRPFAEVACGAHLDILARKYDRFRTGVPLGSINAGQDPAAPVHRLVESALRAKRS